jgi:pimeloyl-ACP methyl ester carboxylesterase
MSQRFLTPIILTVFAAAGCGTVNPSTGEDLAATEASQSPLRSPELPDRHTERTTNVLLVHGAWADGSSWSGVIEALQRSGFATTAVQLREQSLTDDAALVRHAIDGIAAPVVVVGHSYGGVVISEAATGAANVVALVYIAAFGLDEGESVGSESAGYPQPRAFEKIVVDDQGNVTLDRDSFVRYFAADVQPSEAGVLASLQHPIAAGILGTPAGTPAWKTIPSYYQVSTDDQAIDPDLERFFARRMHAKTIELRSGHLSLISHPDIVARWIERAAQGG